MAEMSRDCYWNKWQQEQLKTSVHCNKKHNATGDTKIDTDPAIQAKVFVISIYLMRELCKYFLFQVLYSTSKMLILILCFIVALMTLQALEQGAKKLPKSSSLVIYFD